MGAIYPDLTGPALDAYRKMVATLQQKAMQELNLPTSEIVIRQLTPDDLLPGTASTTADYLFGATANAWSAIGTPAISSVALDDNRFIGINGVHNGQASGTIAEVGWSSVDAGSVGGNKVPSLRGLRVNRKGSLARIWDITPVYDFKNRTGWFDDPVILDQNTTVTIEGLARVAASIRIFTLIGAVAEKRGLVTNP